MLDDETPEYRKEGATLPPSGEVVDYPDDGSSMVVYRRPGDTINFMNEDLSNNEGQGPAGGALYRMTAESGTKYYVSEDWGLMLVESPGVNRHVYDISEQPPASVTLGDVCKVAALPDGKTEPIQNVAMLKNMGRGRHPVSHSLKGQSNPLAKMGSEFEDAQILLEAERKRKTS